MTGDDLVTRITYVCVATAGGLGGVVLQAHQCMAMYRYRNTAPLS